jgi:zinc transporter
MKNENNGLIFGFYLNGPRKGTEISWKDLNSPLPDDANIWLHFDYKNPATIEWIQSASQLNEFVSDALLCEETRPRASLIHNELFLTLRGVNLSPDANPEDMVAIRIWCNDHLIISTRNRPLMSATDIAQNIKINEGPESPGELIAMLADRMIFRMQDTIQEAEDKVADIEEQILTAENFNLRNEIANLRRFAISLRRYLAPQREAMMQLQNEKMGMLTSDDRVFLRETTDHLVRYIEDLDSIRDRAAVTQEELDNHLSEQLNRRMYVLSIVAAIFMPLGFLTGLLGVNVGGIPGSQYPYAFVFFVISLIVLVSTQIWFFKHKKWF